MGIYNDMEDEDEEGDEEEESPGFNMMVLPNAELCGLWLVTLLSSSHLNPTGSP